MQYKYFIRLVSLLTFTLFVGYSFGQQTVLKPKVKKSVFFGKSKPVREMTVVVPGNENRNTKNRVIPNIEDKDPWQHAIPSEESSSLTGASIQSKQGSRSLGGPLLNFEGNNNVDGVAPGDPNGDLGLDYYIQTVNKVFSVYDRTGELIYGPVDNTSIWDGFPGPWNNVSWGADPVFKFDHLAERWVLTAFSVNSDQDLFYEMVAVSVTDDPLGEYYTYAFQFDEFNDYPKLAIWPDGYYITYKMNGNKTTETVVDRAAMLAGEEEATMVMFEDGLGSYSHNPLSSDLEGTTFIEGTPNYVILPVSDASTNPVSAWMYIYEFKVNWDDPDASTFELIAELDVDPVSINFPDGVVQPENYNLIDALFIRYLYPCSYRQFDDHESMVACHTLWNEEGTHLMRWYEIRREEEGDWYVYQQSGYLPDSVERWMGSINMNSNGDIAMGYSASGEETYPSVRYTGRLADDPLNEMTFAEMEPFKGMNVANNVAGSRNRWGDYSSMSVDPVDDSTFWFTTMYTEKNAGWGNWTTRIVSFSLYEEGDETTVNSGPVDTMTCEYPVYEAIGEAENYSSINWTTNGDGSFLVTDELSTIYYYGNQDINSGQVTISLHATGYEPGGEEFVDSTLIYINQAAVAIAGPDTLICNDDILTLNGEVEFTYSYYWSTSGDGIFSDSSQLDAIYTPGQTDIDSGEVVLMLNAQYVAPCDEITTDSLLVTLDDCTFLEETADNRLQISVSPNPTHHLLNIDIQSEYTEALNIELLNTGGKIIFTDKYKYTGQTYTHQLNLRYVPNGIYFLRVYNSQVRKTLKVIKN